MPEQKSEKKPLPNVASSSSESNLQKALKLFKNARSAAGVLRPGSAQLVKVTPPISDATEKPLVLSPATGSITLRSVRPNDSSEGVWVENSTNRTVPFLFVVVPKTLVDLGSLPWKALYTEFMRVLLRTA